MIRFVFWKWNSVSCVENRLREGCFGGGCGSGLGERW